MAKIYAPPQVIKTNYDNFSPSINNLSYLKTVKTIEQYSQKARYDGGEDFWLITNNVNGTISYNSDSTQRVLTISNGATDKIVTQTKQAFVYLSGNVHRFTTAIKLDLQEGATADWGIFDNENGAFFRVTKTSTGFNFYCGRRSKASGTVVDHLTPQNNFSLDKLDGKGNSGTTIDFTKIQMLHIEFSWYGGGGIAYGIEIDRKIIYFHWESAGNHLTEPIFGQPDLPLQYALYNTQITGGNSTIKIAGIFMGVDGSFEERKGKTRTIIIPNKTVIQDNTYVIGCLRPKTNYKGQLNRGYIKLDEVFVFGTTDGYYYVSLNPTPNNTPTWNDVNTNNSMMEYSDDFTITNNDGINLYSGSISSQTENDRKSIFLSKESITAFSDGSGSNCLALIFVCQASGILNCGFNWSEYY